MAEHHRMFVDGEWIEAADGGTFTVSDPATGEVIANVADGGPAEATRAVEAAHRAFPSWAAMPARERAPILHRIQSLMEAHREDLARQVTRENGKPLEEARREVTFALGYFGWFAEEARRAYGDLVPSPAREKRLWVLRQPAGRGRGRHAVELPGDDGDAEDRPGARGRLHGRAQAGIGDAAHGAPPGAARGLGGAPEGRAQRRDRLSLGAQSATPWSSTHSSPSSPSPARPTSARR